MEILPSTSLASLKDSKDIPAYPVYPPRRSSLDYALAMNGGREITWVAKPQTRVSHVVHGASQSQRAFTPLTPIIASPLCTPTVSTSSTYTLAVKSEEEGGGQITGAQDKLPDKLPDIYPSLMKNTPSTPSWITTPPTPPSRQALRLNTSTTCRAPLQCISPSRSFPDIQSKQYAFPSARIPRRRFSVPPATPLRSPFPSSSACNNAPLYHTSNSGAFRKAALAPRECSTSPRLLFHIPRGGHSDNEDEEHRVDGNHENFPDSTANNTSQGGSSDNSSEGRENGAKHKDDVRRYHALMELLKTEVGYLADLRVLVTIYLHRLPTLTCRSSASVSSSSGATVTFGRSTPSSFVHPFPSASRASSFISPSPTTLVTSPSPDVPTPATTIPSTIVKEKDKNSPRYLFSDTDVEVITRNAEELFQLHEHLVGELRAAVSSLGFPMAFEDSGVGSEVELPSAVEIDAAIGVVSTKFATEASRFNSYQAFCSGHLEAFDLLRKIQQQYPVEWDIFERQSSILVSDMNHSGSGPSQNTPNAESPVSNEVPLNASDCDKKRRHSLPTLEVSTHAPLLHQAKSNVNARILHSDTVQLGGKDKEKISHSRLVFVDYLIKPVQRICRYPLLLDQLKTRKTARTSYSREPESRTKHGRHALDMNVVVESASQAMRHVATSVDEAGRRQYISIQSSLIVSRIHLAWSSSAYSAHRAFHLLTPAFLSSLGACLLAGSLDVMHYRSYKAPSAAKIKYLGSFLYMGGYLVLVKVCKGKVYEPRHWFSLVDVDLTDLPDEDAKLPYSFLLSAKGHHFVMGAPCQGEKDAWISAIRESLTVQPWFHEPTTSLQFSAKGGEPSELLESRTQLTGIQSISDDRDVEPNQADSYTVPSSPTERQRKAAPRLDFLSKVEPLPSPPVTPSRRSSSASVKSIFSPLSSDTSNMTRRPSLAVRAHVDRGLEDVISEPCRTARYYASTHEDLSRRQKPSPSFSRSNSGLSMVGVGAMTVAAKNKLTKCEPSRSKSMGPETLPAVLKKTPPKRTLSGKYRKKNLRIVPVTVTVSDGEDGNKDTLSPTQDTISDSPVALSFCSSITTSNPSESLASPITDLPTPSQNEPTAISTESFIFLHERDCPPKRTQSMVDNVKGLFCPQPMSPTSVISESSTQPTTFIDSDAEMHDVASPVLLKWWARGSLRRRVRSAPDVHSEELPSSRTASMDSDASRQVTVTTDDSRNSLANDLTELPSATVCHSSSAAKRLSFFTARRTVIITEAEPGRKSHKNISLLHRLSPMTSGGP